MTKDYDDDQHIILAALQTTIVFWMSVVCRNCRKEIGRKLKRDIPSMIAEAAALASAVSDEIRAKHDTKH